MKRELEEKIIEKIKKGCQPVYYGEEGFIVISMKAYMAAAEYADAESSYFWYGDVYFEMVDLNNREDEIEAEDYDFMPAEIEWEDADSMAAETESEDAEPCKFKVGDIIFPTPEAHKEYVYTGNNLISAEVIAIKGRHSIKIRVKDHKNKLFIGETFSVDPAYFELMSAAYVFAEPEDIEAVYLVIADKCTALATSLYNFYCDRLLELRDDAVYDQIQVIISERERYEKLLSRLADYMEVRKCVQRVMPDDGCEKKTD